MPSFKRCHSIFQPIHFQGRFVLVFGEAFKFDGFSWGKTHPRKMVSGSNRSVVVSGKLEFDLSMSDVENAIDTMDIQYPIHYVRRCGCLCYRRIASTQRYTIRFHCSHLLTSLFCGKQAQSLAKKVWTKESMKIRFFFLPKILPRFLDQNLQQQWSCRLPRKGQYCKNNTIYLCERGHFAKVRNDFQFGNPTSLQEKSDVFCLFGLVWFCFLCFALVLFVCLFVCLLVPSNPFSQLKGWVTAQNHAFTFTVHFRKAMHKGECWKTLKDTFFPFWKLVNQLESTCWCWFAPQSGIWAGNFCHFHPNTKIPRGFTRSPQKKRLKEIPRKFSSFPTELV